MPLRPLIAAFCLSLAACAREAPPQTNAGAEQPVTAAPVVQRAPQAAIDWSPVRLEAGDAWIACSADYHADAGRPVLSLAYTDLRKLMQDCRATGLVRVRYVGKVTASFAALAERSGDVAADLGIGKRILDLDSVGGHVEAAIRAGDAIGENDWTIWVRGDSHCYSACVLLLAAGDMRVVAGPVGIHRMIRVRSSATSRKELGAELRQVSEDLRNYLERNGASVEVYDLMTTVPNRTLHLLDDAELARLGLSGENAVEDDLDRIRLARECGTDFLRRRDLFRRAYEVQCLRPVDGSEPDVDAINACGLGLRERFDFPDPRCPAASPMAELDGAVLKIPDLAVEPADAVPGDAANPVPAADASQAPR